MARIHETDRPAERRALRRQMSALSLALVAVTLVSSIDLPLHLLAQPVPGPLDDSWNALTTALSVTPRGVAYADDSAGDAATPRPGEVTPDGAAREGLATRFRDAGTLASARWRLFNGEPRAAIVELRRLADTGTPPEQAEALYWIASAQLQLDDSKAAQATLDELRRRLPESDPANWATFLTGTLHRRAGAVDAAVAAYRAYRASPAVEPYVQIEIAATLLEAGRHREAADVATAAFGRELGRVPAIEARDVAARARAALGDHPGAATLYRAILDLARAPGFRAEIGVRLGNAERAAGNIPAAIDAYATVVRSYPGTAGARQALDALDALAPKAVSAFERGMVRYRSHRYTEARRLFGQFLDEQPEHPDTPRALFYLAATEEYLDDVTAAVAHYDAVADRFPASERAPDALWYAGRLREQSGNADGAIRTYGRLMERYPSSERAAAAAFRNGLVRHLRRDYGGAIDVWNGLAVNGSDRAARAAALYWRGFAQRALGDAATAAESFRLAEATAPYSFYGVRARLLGSGQAFDGRFRPLTLAAGPSATPEQEAEAREWLRQADPAAGGAVLRLPDEPPWQVATELNRVGLTTFAREEVAGLVERYAGDGPALFTIALALRDEGQFNASMTTALKAARIGNRPIESAPRALRELVYPAYFGGLVLEQARVQGIDPLLMLALIRQESAFDPRAESVAQARGLTQVVPSTGEEIARALGEGDFDARRLFQPAVSVRYGAYYLRGQLEAWDWSPYRALTAYNAGNDNTRRWARWAGADEDMFFEAIDFDETRLYLDLIVPNWAAYLDLYG